MPNEHRISIIKPGEDPGSARSPRIPLSTTVRQVLAAVEAIKVKSGTDEFDASHVATEIGCPTSRAHYGLRALSKKGVVELIPGSKARYMRWRVIDWNRAIHLRQALEQGLVTFDPVGATPEPPKLGVFQRILDAMAGRQSRDQRISALEDQVASMKERLDRLVVELGG